MRNKNGYGSVVHLSGNRSRPYMVRKTVGWTDAGYPIYNIIGYTATREEGQRLLAEYNFTPYDTDTAEMTLGELWDYLAKHKRKRLSESNFCNLRAAFNHAGELANRPYRKIKAVEMQSVIDDCGRGAQTQAAIRNLFIHLDNLALELDIPVRGYARILKTDTAPETTRTRFTDAEIDTLWHSVGTVENADMVLILIYSGWRAREFLALDTASVDLIEGTMRGGEKTKASKNRVVPIHPAIKNFVAERLERYGKLTGFPTYAAFAKAFQFVTVSLGMHHTPHECRHTMESLLDAAGANRRCIDLLMGHVSSDTGNRVYNHKTLDQLRAELIKIPIPTIGKIVAGL